MSMFLVYVVGLIALALLIVLPALLRRRTSEDVGHSAVDPGRANLQVLREQLAALDADLAAGRLNAEQHRLARAEIERRALDEAQDTGQDTARGPVLARRAGKSAVVVGLAIPMFALLLYAGLGKPQALDPVAASVAGAAQGEVTLPQIEAMVEGLAKRLASQTTPQEGDLQRWTMLAKSYAVMNRFEDASRAYARARGLGPESAQLLADHADVMAMLQGQRVEGEPSRLILRALELEPNNLKALAIAGSWSFERRDYAAAVKYWSQAKTLAPPNSGFAAGVENSLQDARAAAAQSGQVIAATDNDQSKPADVSVDGAAERPAGSAAQVRGEVQVAGVLAKRVRPTDTLFVFARAAQGPRMPLAIIRRTAGDLPFAFTLDDSSAMAPQFRLSGFAQVIVGARISASGDATPRSGDLMGQIGPVALGSDKLVLTIDSVVP